jgi:FKBP-type peptidyl-prolyl cis-trans isomerase
MPDRVDLAKPAANGRLSAVHVPRFVSWSLFITLGLAACGRTGAEPPKPLAAAGASGSAPAGGANMSGATWSTPPPTDVSAPPANAEREPSGVARRIVTRGTGTVHPSETSFVDIRYAGWERNGKQFEGSAANGPPGRYALKDLPQGLADELKQMVEGDRHVIWVPGALAYLKRQNFVNAPRGDMTFEVELLRVTPFPEVPPDLKKAPKEAKTTKSGLTYVVLKKGTGKVHPKDDSHAMVFYAAWTPDGNMFQTSVAAGDGMRVKIDKLPPGWREAMKMMVEGDRWRLWLPGKLAFGEIAPGQEAMPFGPPPGPVVFEVELQKVLE